METIIDPICPKVLVKELQNATFIRKTNKANNIIYTTDAHQSPMLMQEIGRLREISFRQGGGGSGKCVDIDDKDRADGYKQLIVWNPDKDEIIGAYRYIMGRDVKLRKDGQPNMAMEHIFRFSEEFISDYLPYTLELGRAFIQPKYQSIAGGIKSLFSLDNLWDGIGAIVAKNHDLKYLIGKVTIYSQTPAIARHAIIHYMSYYFENKENLLIPKCREIVPPEHIAEFESNLCGNDYKKDFKWLNAFVKKHNSSIPPLFHAYIALSDTLCSFGTVFDPTFGNIYDTGIKLTLSDVYNIKKERYIGSYIEEIGADTKRNFV